MCPASRQLAILQGFQEGGFRGDCVDLMQQSIEALPRVSSKLFDDSRFLG